MVLPVVFICCVFVYITVQLCRQTLRFLKHADSESQIKALLRNSLKKTMGERLIVMRFSGLDPKMDSIPYDFMACVYEVFKDGKKPVKQNLLQIPTALYITFLKNLLDGSFILDPLQNNNEISDPCYDYAAAKDESKGLFFILNDGVSSPIGYISLKKAFDFSIDDVRDMRALAAGLSARIKS